MQALIYEVGKQRPALSSTSASPRFCSPEHPFLEAALPPGLNPKTANR